MIIGHTASSWFVDDNFLPLHVSDSLYFFELVINKYKIFYTFWKMIFETLKEPPIAGGSAQIFIS